jgi:hypothetical protein
MKKQILQGSTDSVSCRFENRPSACTVALYSYDGSELTADGADGVTLGASCAVASACGYSQSDRRALILGATGYDDLVVGKAYRLDNSSGQHEWVKFLSLPSDRDTTVQEELAYDYATDDTLVGTTVSRALTAAESATVGVNYRARFSATVSGITSVKDVLFDVVKSVLDQPITADTLSDHDPLINRHLPAEIAGTDWERLLEKSWDRVYHDLVDQQLHPSRIMDPEQLVPLHIYKFKMMLAEIGITPDQDMYPSQAIKHFQFQYATHMQMVLKQLSWYDSDEDLVPDEGETNETIDYPRFRLG